MLKKQIYRKEVENMNDQDKKNQKDKQVGGSNSGSEWETGEEFTQKAGNMTADDVDKQAEDKDNII